jgi:tetratricopeptide (TPR) repeat protein
MKKLIFSVIIGYCIFSTVAMEAQLREPRAFTFANPQLYGAGVFGLFNDADNLTRVGRYEDAILKYGDILAINPIFSEAYFKRSILFSRLGRKEEAAYDMRIANLLNPKVIDLFGSENRLRRLQIIAFKQSDYTPLTDISIVSDSRSEPNINNNTEYQVALATAISYKMTGETEAALAAINTFFVDETVPTSELFKLRGNIFLLMNENWAAIEDYTRAITLNPNFAEAYFNRGLAFILENNRPDGCFDLDKGVLLGYKDGTSLLQSLCGL